MTNPPPPPVDLAFDGSRLPRKILIGCLIAEVFFVLLDAVINYGRLTEIGAIRRLCNIAREDGLATWFQVSQTLLAGLTLWLIFVLCRKTGQNKTSTFGWGVLACFFTFMSADDGAKIHERLGTAFKTLFEEPPPGEAASWGSKLLEVFPSYAWQLVVLPVFACLGLFMMYFIWQQQKKFSTRAILLTGVACFVLAVALDFFEGMEKEHPVNIYTWLENAYELKEYTVLHFAKSLEEFLEMLGISLLWFLFMQHLASMTRGGLQVFSAAETKIQ